MTITIERAFLNDGQRYMFDQALAYTNGWCQVDTQEDASYYGNWTNPNPNLMGIVTFAEGDVYKVSYGTDVEYRADLVALLTRHRIGDRKHAMIDLGISSNRNQLRDRFVELGMAAYIW